MIAVLCDACGGDGAIRSPAWAKWWELEDQLYQEFYARHSKSTQDRWFASDELAQLSQARPAVPPQNPCPHCSGRGTVTTAPARPLMAAGSSRRAR